jgi:2-keto-4-pentenoate hydratase/2-oxohepta-3-ene-1,7-dioic acid hydratase in catechol pathway
MIFSVAELISYTSRHMTLAPGDVLVTGTPAGVILGMADPVWLQPGDEVAIEIDGIGRLANTLTAA